MFKRGLVVARVGLPRKLWEPLRILNDVCGVELNHLAAAFAMSEPEMLKVLCAARIAHLREGDEVAWLDELGFGDASASATCS